MVMFSFLLKFSFPKLLLHKKKPSHYFINGFEVYPSNAQKYWKRNIYILSNFTYNISVSPFTTVNWLYICSPATAFQVLNSFSSHCKQVHFSTTALFRILFCPSFWPWDLEVSSFLLVLTVSCRNIRFF